MSGRLQADPLFQGLARPPMVMGVSYTYFAINGLVTLLFFVHSQNFLAYGLGIILHGFGYLLCRQEPRAVELWMLRMRTGFMSWNRAYHHHTNSYDVF
jgi:type IV secretion system protein VirB3